MSDNSAVCQAPAATLLGAEELTLEQLVDRSKAGSREAFESLVERFEQRIFNFLCQLTGNAHDAEDLAQETFIKAYHNLHRFSSNHGFSTWLFTIAKRTAFNHFRSAKPFQELSGEEELDFDDPSTLLEQKDATRSVWKWARTALNPAQYEALWLRYGEGFSIAETARILNTNQIRVRVLLHRGRNRLAEKLDEADLESTRKYLRNKT